MEKLEWCPSARKYDMYMVSSHTWHNSHQCTATPYQNGTLGHLPAMYSDWYLGTSIDCLWRRPNDMAVHETPTCKDVANDSSPHTRWLGTPSSISTTFNPDLTWFHGLLTQIQMEIDASQAWTIPCRQNPDRPRLTLMDIKHETTLWYMTWSNSTRSFSQWRVHVLKDFSAVFYDYLCI